jgi:hypothetical protein
MDLPMAKQELPQYSDDQRRVAAEDSHVKPELRQVYLRYIGRR